MMENSDSDTFDTLVFDALVSKTEFIPAEVLVSGNKHLDGAFAAQM